MEKMEARLCGSPQRKTQPETQKWCVQISVGDVVMIKRKRTIQELGRYYINCYTHWNSTVKVLQQQTRMRGKMN